MGKLPCAKSMFLLGPLILGLPFEGILYILWEMRLKVSADNVAMYHLPHSKSTIGVISLAWAVELQNTLLGPGQCEHGINSF